MQNLHMVPRESVMALRTPTQQFHLLSYPHILERILDLSDRTTLHAFVLACKTTCATAAPRLYKRVAYHPYQHNPFGGTPLTASIVIAHQRTKHALTQLTHAPGGTSGANGEEKAPRRRTLHDICHTDELSLVQTAPVIDVHLHMADERDATPDGCLSRSRHSPRVKSLEGVKIYFDSAYGMQGGCADPVACSALNALELVKPHYIQIHRALDFSSPRAGSQIHPLVERSATFSRDTKVADRFDSAHYTLVYYSGADAPLFHEPGATLCLPKALSLTVIFLPDPATGRFLPFPHIKSALPSVTSNADPAIDTQWLDHLIFNICRLARIVPSGCKLTIVGAENIATDETDWAAPVAHTMASLIGVDEGNDATSPWATTPSALMRAVYRELHLLPSAGAVMDKRLEDYLAGEGIVYDSSMLGHESEAGSAREGACTQ